MDLFAFIKELSANREIVALDEDSIKQTVILPLFQLLGWNIFSVREVTPEYTLQSNRVDYALLSKDKPTVFVEAKRASINLDDCQEQLLAYSFKAGVRLAVLTNGVNWWFYLPLQEGHWEKRKYFTINVFDQDPDESAKHFQEFLSKSRVLSGEAEDSAKLILKSKTREKAIKLALPKAWEALVAEPDELLIELLKDKVENISGFTPTPDELMSFITKIPEAALDVQPPVCKNARALSARVGMQGTPQFRSKPQLVPGRVGQNEMSYEILKVLQDFGAPMPKVRVEEAIYEKYRTEFAKEWYQGHVSHGIPRWKHIIAWAKERLKHEGLIKRPSDAGHGIWELTDAGKNKKIR